MRMRMCVPLLVGLAILSTVSVAPGLDSGSYPIDAGDVLQIIVYAGGEEQENFTAQVSLDGRITSPLLGDIEAGGLRSSELASGLTERLTHDYYVSPQVVVNVKEYADRVRVSGEVLHPGAYSIRGGLSALNACLLAGGFTQFAALNRVLVIRDTEGRPKLLKINLGKIRKGSQPDLTLQAGDWIDVPHQKF
jgi:polysaccharide export outer membrane protein